MNINLWIIKIFGLCIYVVDFRITMIIGYIVDDIIRKDIDFDHKLLIYDQSFTTMYCYNSYKEFK